MCGPYFTKGTLVEEWKEATKSLDGYHIHIYFHNDFMAETEALDIATKLNTLFPEHVKDISHVGVVGPHAQRNTAVEITKEGFGDIVSWLQMNASESLSILIHPETDDVLKDHLDAAMWIGEPVSFNDQFFDRVKKTQKKRTASAKR